MSLEEEWTKGRHSLGYEQAVEAYALRKKGVEYHRLAEQYGVTRSSMYRAIEAMRKLRKERKGVDALWHWTIGAKHNDGYFYSIVHEVASPISGWRRGSKKDVEKFLRESVKELNKRMKVSIPWML